jgi:2,3-bisphosphoglycerate-dependent phosphoglycerate mutase
MATVVLLRHGESEWNQDDRFAGWEDVALTAKGAEQARRAGTCMRRQGIEFDVCYTSLLRRATHTAWHCLEAMDRSWLPIERSWRLNERHYGALQGLSRSDTARRFGPEQVRLWRRSYATRPPQASAAATALLARDPRYAGVAIPSGESLEDTVARVSTFWEQTLRPSVLAGRTVMAVAHGTSLRGLLMIVTGRSEEDIVRTEIPNGVPIVMDLDGMLQPIRIHSLAPS